VTPVRTAQPPAADSAVHRIVLPDGEGYGQVLGKAGRAHRAKWVERGGVLVALGGRAAGSPGAMWRCSRASRGPDEAEEEGQGRRAGDKADGKGDGKTEGEKEARRRGETGRSKPMRSRRPTPARCRRTRAGQGRTRTRPRPFDYARAIVPTEPPPRTPGDPEGAR
jgi:hypothetical protein